MTTRETGVKPSRFSQLLKLLKEDVTPDHNWFWWQMLGCFVVTLSIIASFFVSAFCYVSGILIFAAVALSALFPRRFGSALNYLVYFYTFSSVLFIPNTGSTFYPYAAALFVAIVGMKWLIDIVRKKEEIQLFKTLAFAAYLGYVCLLFLCKHFSFSSLFSIAIGVLMLYLISIGRSDAKLKDTLFAFLIGIVVSTIVGLFSAHYPSLNGFFDITHAYGVNRYSALFANTNSLSRVVMFGLGALFVLLLNKKLRVLYYPIFFVLFLVAVKTLSKTVFVIMTVAMISAFIILFVKERQKRKAVLTLVLTGVVALTAIFVQSNAFGVLWTRIVSPIKNVVVESNRPVCEKNEEYSFVSEFTTGRTELWKTSISAICDDAKGFMFGHGHGRDYSIGDVIKEDFRLSSPHNSYLQYTYHMGAVGLALFALCLLSIIDLKKFKVNGLPLLLTIILVFAMSDSFSYIGFMFLCLTWLAIQDKDGESVFAGGADGEHLPAGEQKIPKKIHYIWLGGKPLPPIAEKCIASWQKFCPDYEIKRWDETNLDIDITKYSRTAYDMRKFAFASDVLRFDILNKEGGIYLDIDVEIIKNLDKFLEKDLFCGFESETYVNPGIILGAVPGHRIIQNTFESYKTREFKFEPGNQITVCNILTDELVRCGMTPQNAYQEFEDFTVYPMEYFCPKSLTDGKIRLTKNSHGIHHFAGTWIKTSTKIKAKVLQFAKRLMGEKLVAKLKAMKNRKDQASGQALKVLHLLASNKFSGAENVACQIIKMYNEDECEIAYASPDGDIAQRLENDSIKFYPMKSFGVRELRRVIKTYRPDIIHAHDMKAVCLAGFFGKATPVVAHIHRNHSDFHSKTMRAMLLKILSKKKHLKSIIWVSDACYQDYVYKENKTIKEKSQILYNIINPEELIQKSTVCKGESGHDLIYVGRLSDIKNPLRLMNIVSELKKQMVQ